MSKFKPNEKAKIRKDVNFFKDWEKNGQDFPGKECVILEVEPIGEIANEVRDITKQVIYHVRLLNTEIKREAILSEDCLEKRLGSWDKIFEVTGWSPSKPVDKKEPELVD